jgi:hypothetical protein
MLLIPLTSAVVLVHGSSTIAPTRRTAVLGNLLLLGAACWAAVAQYPYPEGNSVIPFAVLVVVTPILSLLALLGGGGKLLRGERRSAPAGG